MQQFPTLFPIAFIFVIFLVFPFCWKNDGIATAKLTSTFSDINKQHDHYHYNLHGRNNNKNNKYSSGVFGIDVSLKTCQDGISLDTWKCLVKNGFQFAIVEVWYVNERTNEQQNNILPLQRVYFRTGIDKQRLSFVFVFNSGMVVINTIPISSNVCKMPEKLE